MSETPSITAVKKPLPYAHRGNLTEGSVRGHLIRMTVPMIWGLFAVIAVQLVDTYFISLLGDTNTLAGFSFTFPVTMIISHFVFGLNIALSSVASRLLGQKLLKDTKRIVLHSMIMALGLSGSIALITYIFMEPIFTALGATEITYPVVAEYMPIWLISSVILTIAVNANSAMRANGDTLIPALVMTVMAAMNAILDPFLIFGHFGMPALGVQGAAIATLTAQIITSVVAAYILVFKKDMVATDGLHLNLFKDSMKRLLVIAIPAGLGNIIMPATGAVIITLIAKYGPEAVAAYGIVSRIEAFSLLLVIALSMGMAPIVGQNWGAKNFGRVHSAIRQAITANFIWSMSVAAILGLAAHQIAGAFSDDAQVILYSKQFFWIVPVSYAFGNLVFGWASAFNAMGMPQKAFVMIAVKAIVMIIPAVYIGGYFYGVTGIFCAIASVNVSAGLFFHFISKRACRQIEAQIAD